MNRTPLDIDFEKEISKYRLMPGFTLFNYKQFGRMRGKKNA